MSPRGVFGMCATATLIACSGDGGRSRFGLVVMTSSPSSYRVSAEAQESGCEVESSDLCRVETCTSRTTPSAEHPPTPGRVVVEGAAFPVTFDPGASSWFAAGPGDLFAGAATLRVRAEASTEADAFDVSLPAPPVIASRSSDVVDGELAIDRSKDLRVEWSERGDVRVAVELSELAFEWQRTVTCEAKLTDGALTLPSTALTDFRPTVATGSRGDVSAELHVRTITEASTGGVVVARAIRASAAMAETIVIR